VEEIELEDIENYYNIKKPKKRGSLVDKEKSLITNMNINNKLSNNDNNKKSSLEAETSIKEINTNDASTTSRSVNVYSNSNNLLFNNKNETNNRTNKRTKDDFEEINNKKLSNTSPVTSPFENSPDLNRNSHNKNNRQSLMNNSLHINNEYAPQNNYNGNGYEEMEYFKKTFEFDQQIFRLPKVNRKPLEEFSKELVNIFLNIFLKLLSKK